MASPQEILAFIEDRVSIIDDGSFRLAVKLDKNGSSLNFFECADATDDIREIISVTAAHYIFLSWLSGRFRTDGQRLIYLRDHYSFLSTLPNLTRELDLTALLPPDALLRRSQRLAHGLLTYNDLTLRNLRMHIELDAIYHENPNWIKLIFSGGALILATTATSFAIAAAYQAYGADDCRKAHLEYGKYQVDKFFDQARLQGKWTPELRESYDAAIKSSSVAAESCNVLFNRFELIPGKFKIILEKYTLDSKPKFR